MKKCPIFIKDQQDAEAKKEKKAQVKTILEKQRAAKSMQLGETPGKLPYGGETYLQVK